VNRILPAVLLPLIGCAAPDGVAPQPREASERSVPAYTASGELVRPTGFETWVAAGSSIGLSYSEHARDDGPGQIHTVYLEPQAFGAYRATGRFPEKTVLVLALHEPRQRESINRQGYFQGDLVAVEVAVKDRERFPEGWAYFDFGKGGRDASARAKAPESCHACHREHAADDNVFVQFYPPLREIHAARQAANAGRREP
jgi:hypothetical protein